MGNIGAGGGNDGNDINKQPIYPMSKFMIEIFVDGKEFDKKIDQDCDDEDNKDDDNKVISEVKDEYHVYSSGIRFFHHEYDRNTHRKNEKTSETGRAERGDRG